MLSYVFCELRRPFPPEKDAVLRKLHGHVARVVSQGDRRPKKIFLEVDKKKVTLTIRGDVSPCSLLLPQRMSAALETSGRKKTEPRVKASGARRGSGWSSSLPRRWESLVQQGWLYVLLPTCSPRALGGFQVKMRGLRGGPERVAGAGVGGARSSQSRMPLPQDTSGGLCEV